MADSSTKGADGPISVTVKVAGSAISDEYQIYRVQVDAGVGRIPEAQLVLMTGSVAENEFPASDGTDFEIGKEISFAAAYGSGSDQELFTGVIVSVRLRVSRGAPRLEVNCIDKAAKLTHTRKSAQYLSKKDSDVMSQIISDAGLTADVTATTDTARDIVRVGCTDWGYLRSIADRSGHVLTISDGTVTSAPPDTSGSAVLTITLGVDMISFDARVDAQTSLGGAEARAWDSTAQEPVSETGTTPAMGSWGTYKPGDLAEVLGDREHMLATAREIPSADLKIVADARTMRTGLATIQGSCVFQGSGKAVPGVVIEISGMGDRFGGNAYIGGVRQLIEDGTWTTEALLGLPDNWNVDSDFFAGESAAGLAAPIHGLQVGKVVKLDEDPDSKMRIKVSLPMVADPAPEVWARYAQPYASSEAGIQFMPEIDDEVLVAFLNADPDAPVVVGSLHNATAPQAATATADNFIKGIVTREAMKLQFDEEKKIITLETPGGHKMTLDDDAKTVTLEDLTGNKLELAESGITMSSPGDISLTADGAVNITATGDASVSGMNVNAEAQTGLTVKGSATAEISSGGQTTVKGSMVMIN
ncbi:Rhs element Vgr protein [Roseobacter sp. YSTF-M11]|uniref:Rhs element Vgr protein n=1 Tax=Roseobacter insulae TaxID=2859783 RepID=A0A9X1FSM8_9RHOB|nr:phage baseplate assembly protein V [Roseobacter insulae]MBW4706654.1 Rhs element Vgr protein [Roseobacter insulae]